MNAPKMLGVGQDTTLVERDDAAAGPSWPTSEPISPEEKQMRRYETARSEGPDQQEPGDGLALCPAWRALLYVALFYVAAVGLAGCAAYCASPSANFAEPARARTEQAALPAAVPVADQVRAIDERLRKIESLVAGWREPGRVARR
jgi:hypothetical protein